MQKNVNLVDLVKSFPTSIDLQKSASIQPRTSPLKFGGKYSILFTGVLRRDAAIGTHEAMGAIWFLDNPALQPEVMSVTARLCNWVQFLFAPTKLLDAIKSAPQTMLAKIANGV